MPDYRVNFEKIVSLDKAIIVGHHDLNPMKDCPCYSMSEYLDLQPK